MPNFYRLASSASMVRQEQPTEFLLNASTHNTGFMTAILLSHQLYANHRRKDSICCGVGASQTISKMLSAIAQYNYSSRKGGKLITAKLVKQLMVKLCHSDVVPMTIIAAREEKNLQYWRYK